jgi:hypothetical protein
MLLALAALTIGGGSNVSAQLSSGGTSLLVPITGVADLGGTFRGTLLIERFAPTANGVAVVGTVTGALTTSGTVRNLVIQMALPLDITASRARLNTDPALAQASCNELHVELGGASINVLGSTIGFQPAAFDITSALQSGTTAAAASTSAQPAVTATSGTVTPTSSTNTTQPGVVASSTPGVATTAPQTAAQTPLGSLLCSVDHFADVSNPTQLAQQLNAILTALGTAQGS